MRTERSTANELIRRRKKKKFVRRSIFFFILIIILGIVLCFRLSYFNITSVNVLNNKLVRAEDVLADSNIKIGTNIFKFKKQQVREMLVANSYISDVIVKRRLPSVVELDIVERVPQFYVLINKQYIIFDSQGYILDILNDIKGFDLIQLAGLAVGEIAPGKRVTEDTKKLKQIGVFADLKKRNISDVHMTYIDVTSNTDIKVHFNNLTAMVGNIDDMEQKLNKVINIISQQGIIEEKGYIDVSFNGDPVMYLEKEGE